MKQDSAQIKTQIQTQALKHFDLVGFASATVPKTIDIYQNWLEQGRHGDMSYLARHLEKKKNPQALLPRAKSWITLALDYDTAEPLSVDLAPQLIAEKRGWISRYARNRDYHHNIEDKMNTLIDELKKLYPSENFLSCVDYKAVLERDAARESGLGWIGKNTCLINQKQGSFIFLSEILTTMDIQPDKAVLDHCGTCTRCLDACPTKALTAPRELDARLCISYWTIESKSPPPATLASKFSYHIYGCDICQDVCPWNKKSRKEKFKNKAETPEASPETLMTTSVDLRNFVKLTPEQIDERIINTAMERAGGKKILENAQRALKNLDTEVQNPDKVF